MITKKYVVDIIYSLGIKRHNASSCIFSLIGFSLFFKYLWLVYQNNKNRHHSCCILSVTDLWPRPFPACQVCSWVQVVPCYLSHLVPPSPLARLQVVRGKYHITASRQGKYHITASRQGKYHTTACRQGEYNTTASCQGKSHNTANRQGKYHTISSRQKGNITLLLVVRGKYHTTASRRNITQLQTVRGNMTQLLVVKGISHSC